jgi:hypothetical protein
MSRNGRWLAVGKRQQGQPDWIEVYRIGDRGIALAASKAAQWRAGSLAIADNSAVVIEGTKASGVWVAERGFTRDLSNPGSTGPSAIWPVLSRSGEFAYWFVGPSFDGVWVTFGGTQVPGPEPKPPPNRLMRLEVNTGEIRPVGQECAWRYGWIFHTFSRVGTYGWMSRGDVLSVDHGGRWVRYRCWGTEKLLATDWAREFPLGSAGTPPELEKRELVRTGRAAWQWVAEGDALPARADAWRNADSLLLRGQPVERGYFAYAGEPDFGLIWDGRPLPWIGGGTGVWYAMLPADSIWGCRRRCGLKARRGSI